MSALEVDVAGAVGALTLTVAFRTSARPLVIVGPNGAGKTSLLMMILGAAPVRRGRIALAGAPLFDDAAGVDVPAEQRGIGFLPQRYALFPHLDVLHNVAYGIRAPSREERRARATAALRELGVDALDVSLRRDVRRFLAERLHAWRLPTVVVTHDPADAEALDGDVLVLEAGVIVQTGSLADLRARPGTEFVRQFAGRASP